jgi:hypothetical protein
MAVPARATWCSARPAARPIDLAALGTGGFRIDGVDAGDFSGFSVSGAGDVNGDGLADLIVGACWSRPRRGSAMLARATWCSAKRHCRVDLANARRGGFRIDGIDWR